ncbi:OHCU decarboxylase [Verrucomicrobiia bacterium DG1235]|nr:OHCU decarboxylase [Verrucomicrobiae bacterium DG1235]
MTLKEANTLPESEYIERLSSLYEYSPWIVARSSSQRPFSTIEAMHNAMETIIRTARAEEKMALLLAHPDLGAKLKQLASLTEFSRAEQSKAGFASLPQTERELLQSTLSRYREKFGHPFILCVTEHSATETLPILKNRIENAPDTERSNSLDQVARIGWHRLNQLITQPLIR